MISSNPESVILNGHPYLVYKDDKGIATKVCKVRGDHEHVVWRRMQFKFSFLVRNEEPVLQKYVMPLDAVMAVMLCDMN